MLLLGIPPLILLIGPQTDHHIARVKGELEAMGAKVISLDYAAGSKVEVDLSDANESIYIDGEPLGEICVAWRRPGPIHPNFDEFSDFRSGFVASAAWLSSIDMICWLLGNRVLNTGSSAPLHNCSMLQLRMAKSVGFSIPSTLITNRHASLMRWAGPADSFLVKPSTSRAQVPNENLSGSSPLTSYRVALDLIADAIPQVETAPILYQNEISKYFDIRVVAFGERVFAFKINSQDFESTKLNWVHDLGFLKYEQFDLELATLDKIRKYLSVAGLFEGHFDLIEDPTRGTTFIECDPHGNWGWLDDVVGGEMSRGLARELFQRDCN